LAGARMPNQVTYSNLYPASPTVGRSGSNSSEVLVSALCKGGDGPPSLQGSTARCNGANGIVGLCMRR
jgi:hypothetical protein